MTIKRPPFKKSGELNDREVPFTETDFYQWLSEGNYTGYRGKDVAAYLVAIGFRMGKDQISAQDLDTLRTISDAYFHREVRPALERGYGGRGGPSAREEGEVRPPSTERGKAWEPCAPPWGPWGKRK